MELGKAIQERVPILIVIILFLIVSIVLIVGSFKVKKTSKSSGLFMVTLGIIGVLASLYGLLFTVFFGFNF